MSSTLIATGKCGTCDGTGTKCEPCNFTGKCPECNGRGIDSHGNQCYRCVTLVDPEPRAVNVVESTDARVWPTLHPDALHGIAGRIIETIQPHTEADPAAMLASLLTGWGSVLGAAPHARVGGARHPARFDMCIVGDTAKARKGTSWREVRPVLSAIDADWAKHRISGGLSSGEGLIAAVADPVTTDDSKPARSTDKRLLVLEEEFVRVLKVMQRDGSTLGAILRQAWDDGTLRVLTKQAQEATGAHVSILGHITVNELNKNLTETDIANGLANRFMFVCATRGPLLPFGGNLDTQVLDDYGRQLSRIASDARRVGTLTRTPEADQRWAQLYTDIADDDPGGILGALVARADAQLLRLSVGYATLDAAPSIDVDHINAAWAFWKYCRASAEYVFGDAEGDAIADKLLEYLRSAGPKGLDLTEQSQRFGRNVTAARLQQARELLERRGKARTAPEPTEGAGRPRTVTRATHGGAR